MIILRKEGLFWRAYEVSAWLFITSLKEYNPTKKFYKVISNEVVHIGFTENKTMLRLAQIKTQCTINKEEKQINEQIENVSCQLTGWQRSIDKK